MNKDYSYYDILEIASTASAAEIQSAYQRAKATYGNDNPALYTMFTEVEARELLKLVEEAYSVLSSPPLRSRYDLNLSSQPIADANSAALDALVKNSAFAKDNVNEKAQIPVTIRPVQASIPKPGALHTNYEKNPETEQEIENQTVFDGPFLKRIRLYKNLTVEQIGQISKISNTYINAVENNNYKALPAPVFTRGFICQIAKILSLSEKKVADSYMKLYKEGIGKK